MMILLKESVFFILPFIGILTLVVFIHELGHYLPGYFLGVGMDTFSIGFGPELIGRTDTHGTRWKICLIPLGGYVRFLGDASADSTPQDNIENTLSLEDQKKCLHLRSPWQRILVYIGGPLANYVLAFGLLVCIYSQWGLQSTPAEIGGFIDNSPAQSAGLLTGDRIIMINDTTIEEFQDIAKYLGQFKGDSLTVTVDRAGQRLAYPVIPVDMTASSGSAYKKIKLLGIKPSIKSVYKDPLPLGQAIRSAVSFLERMTYDTSISLWHMVTGQRALDGLSGPVGIASMAHTVSQGEWGTILFFIALISASLGFFNLLPIPILDGGRVVLSMIEIMRGGRAISVKIQEKLMIIGLILMGGILVISTKNDLKYSQTISNFIKNIVHLKD